MDGTGRICHAGDASTTYTSQSPQFDQQPQAAPFSYCPHCGPAGAATPRKEKRLSLWWGISGGTILSAVGFVALALFEQYNDGLTELRNDLKHFNESSGDLVKKEEWRNRMTIIKSAFKDLQAANLAGVAREARVGQVEQQLKAYAEERKEMACEMQRLRERLATVEGRQAAAPIVVPVMPGKK
jgi:hypothetical protein